MDGEWEAPMIDNTNFKGEWKPKQVRFIFFIIQVTEVTKRSPNFF